MFDFAIRNDISLDERNACCHATLIFHDVKFLFHGLGMGLLYPRQLPDGNHAAFLNPNSDPATSTSTTSLGPNLPCRMALDSGFSSSC